ncbi:MAG: hypothetical protein CMP56_03235 [Flavobacteriales bacterium]|nr:hypothetical protein [Flavobacteriales bacterium]|tara:strand:+ start:459 stop:1115 length:657 start_codon:yes stop_codon:yes gene_type:complete
MIIDIIKKDITPSHIEDIAINILASMEEYKTQIMPVVNGENKFLGIIEEVSILNMDNIQQSLQFTQREFKNIFTFLESHIFESIRIISENKIAILPVINKNFQYIGYITAIDILRKIGQNSMMTQETNIIVIAVTPKNYSIYEISRLIEENSGKIITLWHETSEEKLHLHLLITSNNTKSIIKTLERYDYVITESFLETSNSENLNDRFESFIKYLNP